ncbi:MAG: DUF4136 domain-containing protein [Gammaproteobacteria bacterium]|nr:DUF4136 domain-containing protein [Gammaproteobacteria bacterium]
MPRLLLPLLSLLLFLTACTQAPVSFDYDQSAYLKTLKTYAISAPASTNGGFQSLDNNRIETALRSALAGRQMQEVPADKADFLVSYRVEADRQLDTSGVSFGFGVSGGGGGMGGIGVGASTGPKAKEVVEGKLVVDVIDPQKKQVVWSARANENLTDSMNSAKRDKLIGFLVTTMFEGFPPQ